MATRCKEKKELVRAKEIIERRKRIVEILEDSKKLVMKTSNLSQLHALENRCKKVALPRKAPVYDKDARKRSYEKTKGIVSVERIEKRKAIRELEISNIEDFFQS